MPDQANPGIPQAPAGRGTAEQRLAELESWAQATYRFVGAGAGDYIGKRLSGQQTAQQQAFAALEVLTQDISDPPTKGQVAALQAKLNEIQGLLSGAPASDGES